MRATDPVAAAPVGVAPVAPDYRNSAETAHISTYGTASNTKPAKDVTVKSIRKPAAAPEVSLEKLPERQADRAAKTAKSTEQQSEKGKGAVLYKSTNVASVPSYNSQNEPQQKPPSAVARWLKLNLPSQKSGDSKANGNPVEKITETQPPLAPSITEQTATQDTLDEGKVTVSLNDSEQLKVNGSTDVFVKTDKKLNYKTFRLHEPERYVIDFDGLAALETTQLPALSEEMLVKGMRTGTPDDTGLTHRLVLDLKDNTVDVFDDLIENGTALSLKVRPSANAPMPATLKAQLVRDKLIILDAGHGGSDPGAQRSGVSEKDLTMQITNQLKKRLLQLGARVIMTRTDDTFVSLEDRVKITNENQADLFLSIHINALESTSSIYGVETYYQTEQSRLLAVAIHQQLVQGLGVPDRSVRKARFYVINHTPVPAILAEVGFISNPKERDNLGTSEYQAKIADSVSQGVVQYLTEKQELAGKSPKASF